MVLNSVFSIVKGLPREFWGMVALSVFFGIILFISDRKAMTPNGYHAKDE